MIAIGEVAVEDQVSNYKDAIMEILGGGKFNELNKTAPNFVKTTGCHVVEGEQAELCNCKLIKLKSSINVIN